MQKIEGFKKKLHCFYKIILLLILNIYISGN